MDRSGESADSGNNSLETKACHILLLDDELAVRKGLSRLLKSIGHQCTTATIGEEILEIIQSAQQTGTSYDLAILDMKIIGGMGGKETMQKMKELGSTIPIISMSGFVIEEIFSSEADRKGFSGHLQKPFSKAELKSQIKRLCVH